MESIKQMLVHLKDRWRKGGREEQRINLPDRSEICENEDRTGWISPQYNQSKSIRLDPSVLLANRCFSYFPHIPETEAYRVLRSRIMQVIKSSGGKVIMVTSALPGEGKTLTAINLSFIFAREFQHTVLLVDADLRKQSVHRYLGYAYDRGLADYLLRNASLQDLITWPGVEKIALISGGESVRESAELLGSPKMKELVVDVKNRYPERIVIFDVPPILIGADAQTFATSVDHILIVVEEGRTSLLDVEKALQFLPQEKILGFVLNRSEHASPMVHSSKYASYCEDAPAGS